MGKRYAHTMLPSTSLRYPSRIVVFDCDSRSEIVTSRPLIESEEIYQWYAHATLLKNGEKQSSFSAGGTVPATFWAKMDRMLVQGETVWLVLYRASRSLALLQFWDMMENGDLYLDGDDDWCSPDEHNKRNKWNRGLCVIEDPPTIILCRRKGHNGLLKIIDIRNYGITELARVKWAKERANQLDHIVHRMIGTLRTNDLGSLRETAGSQGQMILRHRFLPQGLQVHTYASSLKLERASYHGGRCEAFHIGRLQTQCYMLDVNSMYPYVCMGNHLPLYPIVHTDTNCQEEINIDDRYSLYIADVTLATNRPDYPVSVIFDRDNHMRQYEYWHEELDYANRPQTIYPIGTYRTALAGPEFLDAYRHNRILKIHGLTVYHGEKFLADWCSTLYGLRMDFQREGNTALVQWAKSMLVAGIGKFGATYHQWVDDKTVPATEPYCQWIYSDKDGKLTRYRSVAWNVQKEEVGPNGHESIPSVASYITSLARVELLYLIRTAGYRHVFYCDTDALVVDQEGYDTLRLLGRVDDTRVGYLKHVSEGIDTEILGIKHYRIGGKYACAGIPRQTDLPPGQDMKVWSWDKPQECISQGRKPLPRKRLLEYNCHAKYHHGLVGRDGRVTPHVIGGVCNERPKV